MSSIVDIYNGLLKYKNNDIVIVIDDTNIIWFYAIQICKILEYKSTNKTLQHNVNKNNKVSYQTIKIYSKYMYNVQDHAIFINEYGLYELIMKSHMKKAKEFQNWITSDVIPKIRKFGKYDSDNKDDLHKLNLELDKYKKRVKILANNQKKERYPKGGYIYVVQPPEYEISDDLFKTGKTDNDLNKRLNTYNTTLPDKVVVRYKLKVKDPIAVEYCVKGFLHKYRYSDKKEYYKTKLSKIKKVIKVCDDMINGKKRLLKRNIIDNNENDDETNDDLFYLVSIPKEQKGGYTSINTIQKYANNKDDYKKLKIFKFFLTQIY
jgi:prophage antirepressor-like protein